MDLPGLLLSDDKKKNKEPRKSSFPHPVNPQAKPPSLGNLGLSSGQFLPARLSTCTVDSKQNAGGTNSRHSTPEETKKNQVFLS